MCGSFPFSFSPKIIAPLVRCRGKMKFSFQGPALSPIGWQQQQRSLPPPLPLLPSPADRVHFLHLRRVEVASRTHPPAWQLTPSSGLPSTFYSPGLLLHYKTLLLPSKQIPTGLTQLLCPLAIRGCRRGGLLALFSELLHTYASPGNGILDVIYQASFASKKLSFWHKFK